MHYLLMWLILIHRGLSLEMKILRQFLLDTLGMFGKA